MEHGRRGFHVVLLLGRLAPLTGGLEAWTHNLAAALAERGYRVTVLATAAEEPPPKVTVRLVPAIAAPLPQARAFTAAAAALKADIVHDTGIGLGADLFQPQAGARALDLARHRAALPLSRRLRLAVSPGHHRFVREILALERAQFAAAGRIIAVSRQTLAVFRHRYGLAPERLVLLPNGVDTTRFHPSLAARHREAVRARFGLDPQALVFLAVAHHFRLKGVQHAIAALARLPNAHLLVAGGGEIAEFAALARRTGVAERVRFLGVVDRMEALYGAVDALVHATAHDACSLATLEGLACGLPVITTTRDGAAEAITPGQDGIVLPQPDTAALARAMAELADAQRRQTLGQAARRVALAHDFATSVSHLESLYAEVLRTRASGCQEAT